MSVRHDLQLNPPYYIYMVYTSVSVSEPFSTHMSTRGVLHFPTKAFQFLEVIAAHTASQNESSLFIYLAVGDTEMGSSSC